MFHNQALRRLFRPSNADSGAGGIRLIILLAVVAGIAALLSTADLSGNDAQSRFAKNVVESMSRAFSGVIPKGAGKANDAEKEDTSDQEKAEHRDLNAIAAALAKIGTKNSKSDSGGEVIRYVDVSGQAHYVDSFEKVPEQYRRSVDPEHRLPKITKTDNVMAKPSPTSTTSGGVSPAAAKREKVEVFVTSWCPYCRKLEGILKGEGIRYTRYDIEKDTQAAELHRSLGGGGVPLTRIGNKVIRGFAPQEIRDALR